MIRYDNLRKQKLTGSLQTFVLAGLMIFLALFLGNQLLGNFGMFAAAALGLFVAFVAFRSSAPRLLARTIPVTAYEAPDIHEIVTRLSRRAGLGAVPHIHILPAPIMNAMTFEYAGSPHLVLSEPLLESLSTRELVGVVAHEISHIRNGDLRLFRFVEVVRQATAAMSQFGWILLLFSIPFMFVSSGVVPLSLTLALIAAPLSSLLLQLALFRTREFKADLTAAELSGDPRGLAQALYRIDRPQTDLFRLLVPVAAPSESSLFRTHPDTKERIRRLLSVAAPQVVGL